eukprot:5524877-Prymnesium_polylepis.1
MPIDPGHGGPTCDKDRPVEAARAAPMYGVTAVRLYSCCCTNYSRNVQRAHSQRARSAREAEGA